MLEYEAWRRKDAHLPRPTSRNSNGKCQRHEAYSDSSGLNASHEDSLGEFLCKQKQVLTQATLYCYLLTFCTLAFTFIIKHTSGAMYVLLKGISTLISQVALAPMENLWLEHRIRSQKNADQDASAIWICISRR